MLVPEFKEGLSLPAFKSLQEFGLQWRSRDYEGQEITRRDQPDSHAHSLEVGGSDLIPQQPLTAEWQQFSSNLL